MRGADADEAFSGGGGIQVAGFQQEWGVDTHARH